MKNYYFFYASLLLVLILAFWRIDSYYLRNIYDAVFLTNTAKNKIVTLLDHIENEYVEDIDTDSLADDIVSWIIKDLDTHSVYIQKDENQRIEDKMMGRFFGVGIRYTLYKDTITIINVMQNSPAYKSGLLAGDRILLIDSDTVTDKKRTLQQVAAIFAEKKEEDMNLVVYRKYVDSIFNVSVGKKTISLNSVSAHYQLKKHIGYIKIDYFSSTTYKEFLEALETFKKDSIKALVIDLRDNPGGYLDAGVAVADALIPKGKLIVSVEYRNKSREYIIAEENCLFCDNPIYIIINERSASASEVLAASLQDNDLATIVGTTSYGKASVQRDVNMTDKSAVRLTIAKYYTPTGRSVDRNTKKDSIQNKFVTPKGKIVYGGGGISPDISLHKNETEFLYYFVTNEASQFIFNYLENGYRGSFYNMYENSNKFVNDFRVDEKMLREFKIELQEKELYTPLLEDELLANRLKANIGKQYYGEEVYQQIINIHDPYIKQIYKNYEEMNISKTVE